MKQLLLLLFFFMICSKTFSQAPDTTWTRAIDGGGQWDFGVSIDLTSDGGYLVGGRNSSGDDNKIWVLRTDPVGDTLWTNTFPGNNGYGNNSMQQTLDGGFIIVGTYQEDVFLIKLDESGDTLWTRYYGGEGYDAGSSICQTIDGGYIITGSTTSTDNEGDLWLIKTNSTGDTSWTKTYNRYHGDSGHSVQQLNEGGYIVVGTSGWGMFPIEIWLLKTDSKGDTLWTTIITGGEDSKDDCRYVQKTVDDGFILIGTFDTNTDAKIALIKIDKHGSTQWTKIFNFDLGGSDFGSDVQQTTDNGFVVTGNTTAKGTNDLYVLRTDSIGNLLWLKIIEEEYDQSGNGIKQTIDGEYIIVGSATLNTIHQYDIWLIKLDADDILNIEEENIVGIKTHHLYQNYPNPFNPRTAISYKLPTISQVDLSIYNILGQKVATLVSEQHLAGTYKVEWDASDFASGVYLYRLKTGKGFDQIKKLVLLK